jgi:TolA-binding protein
MVFSDPLHDVDGAPGHWSRVIKAGGQFWNEDQIALWSYPQAQVAQSLGLDANQKTLLAALRLPFRAYLTVADDPNNPGQKVLALEERVRDSALRELDKKVRQENQYERVASRTTVGRQGQARLQQLAGNLAAAVSEYTDVQSRSREVIRAVAPFQADAENRQYMAMHLRAIDDASFWAGVCKYRQGEFLVAERTFARYIKQSTERSAWVPSARYLLAQSLAAQKKYNQAVKVLEQADEDDPQFAGYRVLIGRYAALAAKAD